MIRLFFLFALCISALNAEEPPQAVVLTTVTESQVNPCITGIGTFTAYNDVVLKAEIPGRIEVVCFQEGARTKENEVLFKLHSKEQEAEVQKAEASLQLSKNTLRRKKELNKRGFVSPQDLETVEANVKSHEAGVALAKEELAKTQILAPFEGILSVRKVCKGSYVIEGDDLVRIQDLTPIRLTFQVPQKEIPNIKVGDMVTSTTDVYPDKMFEGKIEAIEPSVNEKTRSVTVFATFSNDEEKLIPGLYGRAEIKTALKSSTSIFIPEQALVVRPDGIYVYKKVGNKVALTKVTLGTRTSDQAEVLSGLQKGDEIVLEGQDKIHDGSAILVN